RSWCAMNGSSATESSALGSGSSFAIYDLTSDADGVIGLRALRPNEYSGGDVIRNPANGGTTALGSHFLLTGAVNTEGSVNAMKSLTFEPGAALTLEPGETLRLGRPGLLVRAGADAQITGGTLDFGFLEGRIFTSGDATISSTLRGANGIRKGGPGLLTLTGSDDFAGSITIEDGRLRATPEALNDREIRLANRGTLDLAGAETNLGSLSGTGTLEVGAATVSLGTKPGDFIFAGDLIGSGSLRIVDGGLPRAMRHLTGRNALSGGIILESGRLLVGSSESFGSGPITARGGGLGADFSGTLLPNPIQLDDTLEIAGLGSLTIPASGSIEGSSPLIVRVGSLNVETASGATGAWRTEFDYFQSYNSFYYSTREITFRGPLGTATSVPVFEIQDGGRLTLSAELGNVSGPQGRIGDSADVELRSSAFSMVGYPSLATDEAIGLLAGTGIATVKISGDDIRLHATALDRRDRASFFFGGISSDPNAMAGIFFSDPPVAVGSGIPILPYAMARLADAHYENGDTFVSVSGNRLRKLALGEYDADLSLAGPGSNVRLQSPVTNNSLRIVNSLLLDAPQSGLSGTGTVQIESGALASVGSWVVDNNVAFGNAEGIIYVSSRSLSTDPLRINGEISGTNGLTKSGLGELQLTAGNTFTGPLTINEGSISFSDPAALGSDQSPIRVYGGARRAGLSFTGDADAEFSRGIRIAGGQASVAGSANGGSLNLTGVIEGIGGLFLTSGTTILSAVNTYEGITGIENTTQIADDRAFGASSRIRLEGGTLRLRGPWNTVRDIEVLNTSTIPLKPGTIDTNGHDATFAGNLRGQVLTKTGMGTLTLTPEAFVGNSGLTISEGTMVANLDLDEVSRVTVGSGATLIAAGVLAGDTATISGRLETPSGANTLWTRELTLNDGAAVHLELLSDTEFDALVTTENFTLNGLVDLEITLAFDPVDFTDTFSIVRNFGAVGRTGGSHFRYDATELGEGDIFAVGPQEFQITYLGGAGQDVVLHAVPEPGVAGLVGLAAALIGIRRRAERLDRRPSSSATLIDTVSSGCAESFSVFSG
ncbi:MAG: autotransporter-associated beta strand repeat-containing protein, partial [Chthoniobacteraceae bacterium]